MNNTTFFEELVYPFRHMGVLVALLVFAFLLVFVGILGEIVAALLGADPALFALLAQVLVVLPALLRFILGYLEARLRGVEPATLRYEQFSWFGALWSIWPIVPLLASGALFLFLDGRGDTALAWLFVVAAALILPALMAIVTVTHSILESLNPLAIVRLILRARETYWIAPATLVVIAFVLQALAGIHVFFFQVVLILLALVGAGVTGWILRPINLFDEVRIHVDETIGEEKRRSTDDKQREATLGHAYGFASRENVAGALDHITSALEQDRGADEAWGWYFENMLKWENTFPAMKFAQLYISYLLSEGRTIDVAKITMRCRIIDERFKPKSEDLPAVIAALEASGNPELAQQLRY